MLKINNVKLTWLTRWQFLLMVSITTSQMFLWWRFTWFVGVKSSLHQPQHELHHSSRKSTIISQLLGLLHSHRLYRLIMLRSYFTLHFYHCLTVFYFQFSIPF